jgi:uncharacterized protein (DUF983 family)
MGVVRKRRKVLESSNATARKRSIVTVLARSLRLQCPACGKSSILAGPFQVRHHCPNCRSLFKREEGFFVGAILANVMATEFVILVVCLVWLILIGSSYETVLVGLFIVALLFPVAFYHHSWSLWLGFDYLIEGLPRYEKETSSDR